ncbi:heme NO-binding domain-containing protein [Celerinatantimonas sp. YJH-8]|uniref:heme NO-binding domain-containing protein n=1 Tax=Celerinatantimonas sp. YJH-8 TaxID=3228714 RepID=UPI0038C3464F
MMAMIEPVKTFLQRQFRAESGLDELLAMDAAELSSHYEHPVQLIDRIAHQLHQDSVSLQRRFGEQIFEYLLYEKPDLFDNSSNCFEMFLHPDTPLQLEIAELYHDHEPPRFTILQMQDNLLVMDYQSSMPFAHVCHGFLQACAAHFGQTLGIRQQLINGALNHARFHLTCTIN